MPSRYQKIVLALAGIVVGVAIYTVPDMLLNLGEEVSAAFKSLCALLLLIAGIIAARIHHSAATAFTLPAVIVLIGLLAFGGIIRFQELGAFLL